MADYHALKCSDDGGVIEIVAHFPMPAGTNIAGFTYALSLASDPDVVTASVVPNITPADNGTKFERTYQFRTHKDIPNAQKQTALDALYPLKLVEEQAKLVERYKFYGFNRTVT